jgi:hypothetical protein
MDLNLHSLPLILKDGMKISLIHPSVPIAIGRGKIEEICSKCTMV